MAERTKLIAGNWKMNGLRGDGLALARALAGRGRAPPGAAFLVCPPATLLAETAALLDGSAIALGGQDCHAEATGAHTGDISAEMLKDLGCTHVILGHSERRRDHGEDDSIVRAKTLAAWRAGLVAIVCVGESEDERKAGNAVPRVTAQLAGSLPPKAAAGSLVIAYEPLWAIGSGQVPKAAEIVRMHEAIGAAAPSGTPILYGGSVNPRNAAEILHLAGVDGALVGGASLKAADFWAIAEGCA